jgi:hypothetical protein
MTNLHIDENLTVFSLKNEHNYNLSITSSINEIISIISLLIYDYVNNIKNKNIHSEYIFDSGLNTLIHVFKIVFINTKNLKVAYYYSQQSYYIFLDFINQLNNVSISFLNLRVKDAVLFSLRKTIFDIVLSPKQITENDNKIVLNIDKIITIMTNVFYKYSKLLTQNNNNIKEFIGLNEQLKNLLCLKKKDDKIYETIICFQEYIKSKELTYSEYYNLLNIMINLFFKKKYYNINIHNYVDFDEFDKYIELVEEENN